MTKKGINNMKNQFDRCNELLLELNDMSDALVLSGVYRDGERPGQGFQLVKGNSRGCLMLCYETLKKVASEAEIPCTEVFSTIVGTAMHDGWLTSKEMELSNMISPSTIKLMKEFEKEKKNGSK